MLSRRSFLIGGGTITLGSLLSGCGNQSTALRVLSLQGSIPAQVLRLFSRKLPENPSISFKPQPQLKDLWEILENWQKDDLDTKGFRRLISQIPLINRKTPQMVDLVTLGDAWLAKAIKDKLIDPLPLELIPTWNQLPSMWQDLVKRDQQGNLMEQGQIWAAPYRWGTTLIAYNSEKFKKLGWTPTDWSDLWRTELRDRISLVDQPREVIGLTLKKLGYSYNETDLSKVKNLTSELFALQKQVKYYSSQYYLQPLLVGDVWLSVGWSSDILPLVNNNPKIKAVIPQSGTSLWSDVWVKPKVKKGDSSLSELTKKWIDFCWQDQTAEQISLLTDGASPLIYNVKNLSPKVKDNPLVFINKSIMNKCEFIRPLESEIQQKYENTWKKMRES